MYQLDVGRDLIIGASSGCRRNCARTDAEPALADRAKSSPTATTVPLAPDEQEHWLRSSAKSRQPRRGLYCRRGRTPSVVHALGWRDRACSCWRRTREVVVGAANFNRRGTLAALPTRGNADHCVAQTREAVAIRGPAAVATGYPQGCLVGVGSPPRRRSAFVCAAGCVQSASENGLRARSTARCCGAPGLPLLCRSHFEASATSVRVLDRRWPGQACDSAYDRPARPRRRRLPDRDVHAITTRGAALEPLACRARRPFVPTKCRVAPVVLFAYLPWTFAMPEIALPPMRSALEAVGLPSAGVCHGQPAGRTRSTAEGVRKAVSRRPVRLVVGSGATHAAG